MECLSKKEIQRARGREARPSFGHPGMTLPMKVKPMPKESVFCLARSHDLANRIVDRVKTSGFTTHDVSALFPNQDTRLHSAQARNGRLPRREHRGMSQRAAWWTARRNGFASIGALTIPGAGPF